MAEKKKSTSDYSSLEGAHKYFTKNVLPQDVHASIRKITSSTPYSHNRDETFFLVRSGYGTLTVNGVDYKIKPNTLINLSPFHRFYFEPDPGKTLEIAEARMNSGTYVYLIANPYYRHKKMTVPSEPPIFYLSGMMETIANQAMDGMIRECQQNTRDKISLCFCYMTDLFGILVEEAEKKWLRSKNSKK